MKNLVLVLVVLFMAVGCLESNPQPSPGTGDDAGSIQEYASPTVDEQQVLVSGVGADDKIAVIGNGGAAPGADYAEAWSADSNDDEDQEGESFDVDLSGGFGGVIPTVVDGDLVIVFHYPDTFDPRQVKVRLTIPEIEIGDKSAPWLADRDSDAEPTPGSGYVPEDVWDLNGEEGALEVSIQYDEASSVAVVAGTDWTTTPQSLVAALNPANGAYATTQSDSVGAFDLTIDGISGDTILVFAVNPEDHEKATSTLELSVP